MLQTPFPGLLVYAVPLGDMGCTTCVYLPSDPPSRVGWGIGAARPPLRGRGGDCSQRTASHADYAYGDYEAAKREDSPKGSSYRERNATRGKVSGGPASQVESPRESDSGKRNASSSSQQSVSHRIRPSRVYSNIHLLFNRAKHFADMVKQAHKKQTTKGQTAPRRRGSIGGDKNRTLLISISSKTVWDEELGGPLEKKKTWINIPEVSVSAPELIPFAEAIPVRSQLMNVHMCKL